MRDKIGEPPVLYDSLMAAKSTLLITNYLKNKGYFYAEADYRHRIHHKRAEVIYTVKPGYLYRMRNIYFPDGTSQLHQIISKHKNKSLLQSGEPFDVSALKAERERIADLLRNQGYYLFNREMVYFDLDSTPGNRRVDVYLRISDPEDSLQHAVFYIDSIYVFPDITDNKAVKKPTTLDTSYYREFVFISKKKRYRKKVLASAIHFARDSIYRVTDHNATISHLSELGVFRYVNIDYRLKTQNGKNYLNCYIYLSPSKRQEIAAEFEANNNTDYNLGTSLTISYRNKNTFRGTELLSLSISGGFESNLERGSRFFNTVDLQFKADLYFNQFLLPFRIKVPKTARPKTRLTFRNEYLRRTEYYTTNTFIFLFGYEWYRGQTQRHIVNPLVFNFVKIFESTPTFQEILRQSPSLRNSFTQQMIFGFEYNFIWTNQSIHRGRSFFYYIGKINSSGNFLHLINLLAHLNDSKKPPYQVVGVDYSQFFLVDSDIRNYLRLHRTVQLVSRLYGGIGVPFGNSTTLTYVKQFFSGGANSMRGWRIRSLGPGAFNFETSNIYNETGQFFFDQTGEIKLEANTELRFDIYKFIKGAVFFDIGNIWLLRADTSRPYANIDISRFWNEFAIGSGLGLRFDFTYFVLRFDVGLKLREPALGKQRWPIASFNPGNKAWRQENMRFNLAIGYPF